MGLASLPLRAPAGQQKAGGGRSEGSIAEEGGDEEGGEEGGKEGGADAQGAIDSARESAKGGD